MEDPVQCFAIRVMLQHCVAHFRFTNRRRGSSCDQYLLQGDDRHHAPSHYCIPGSSLSPHSLLRILDSSARSLGHAAFAITFHNINSICQLPQASSPTITMSLAGNAFRRSVEYHAYFSPSENFNQNVKSLKSLWALLLTGSFLSSSRAVLAAKCSSCSVSAGNFLADTWRIIAFQRAFGARSLRWLRAVSPSLSFDIDHLTYSHRKLTVFASTAVRFLCCQVSVRNELQRRCRLVHGQLQVSSMNLH